MFKRAAVVFTAMSCMTLGMVRSVGLTAASGAGSTLTLENNTGAAANIFGLPALASPATVSGNTVVLNYAAAQYSNIVGIAGTQLMLPSNFGTANSPAATTAVTAPVGTGPYTLNNYSSTLVSYKANPHYWGGTPAAATINVPSYASNTDAATALAAGQLDWAGNDIANVNKIFVDANKTTNHIYFAPGSTVTLVNGHLVTLNSNVTKWPFTNVAVRQAV